MNQYHMCKILTSEYDIPSNKYIRASSNAQNSAIRVNWNSLSCVVILLSLLIITQSNAYYIDRNARSW